MSEEIVEIPASRFFGVCLLLSGLIGILTWNRPAIIEVLGLEVLATVIALFIFSSIRYRIDKNAITYGALLVITTTFFPIWWPNAPLRKTLEQEGAGALWEAARTYLFSLEGLEQLIHADTMLFILGLTFFVSVISQTRLLETISMRMLYCLKGRVFSTVLLIVALVSLASGILDGVSMIGLLIRVLLIILVMAQVSKESIQFIVMASVIITTVCGMWLAYGEPPNLIMKSNLHLPDLFFLEYTMPMAVVSFFIVAGFIYFHLRVRVIPIYSLDVIEKNLADIRFLQVQRYGAVKEMSELMQDYGHRFPDQAQAVYAHIQKGRSPIASMMNAGVDRETIDAFIDEYLGDKFVEPVYAYYLTQGEEGEDTLKGERIEQMLMPVRGQRRRSQRWGILAFAPFIALLLWHAQDHSLPLFVAPAVGFLCALIGIASYPKTWRLALVEAAHEYKEYLFLFPLFFSMTLLTAVGFFNQMKQMIDQGVAVLGHANVAVIQFIGSGMLSALLDNNVVADFASRAIDGMPHMFLFAAAQIAGYAAGGSLTHIGSAQSVVAYAFLLRMIDARFTPWRWILAMWRMVLAITLALIVVIYLMAALGM